MEQPEHELFPCTNFLDTTEGICWHCGWPKSYHDGDATHQPDDDDDDCWNRMRGDR